MSDGQRTRLAVDIGGTFTDVVLEVGAERHSAKVLTTPAYPEQGFLDGMQIALEAAAIDENAIDLIVHGTTLATNALIERKGAKVGFVTTEGFASLLDMGYEKRFDHYDLMIDPVPAIVPAPQRFEIPERLAADGTPLIALDQHAVRQAAVTMAQNGIEAVAIGYLHAFAHARHEARTRQILREYLPQSVTICASHEVCPEIREYERFVTTCANAAVRPLMAGYLQRLQSRLRERGVDAPMLLMTSGGGLTTVENACAFPVRLIESGPAGGAILAGHIARQCQLDDVLAFDMGGTTAKICLLSGGEPERARRFEVARSYRNLKGSGWPLRIPVIDMVEIGAGGGSIARVDRLGQITVGPDSAGADPGPVAYARGGQEPTVTDANLQLGKIDGERFAGGKIVLDGDAASAALREAIGKPLALDGVWPAVGVVEIVDENMANAARVHAIERGKDISSMTAIAFGGGAPLHACRVAEKLGIKRILVPQGAGVGSAIGFLRAPVAYDVTRSRTMALDDFVSNAANKLLDKMEEAAAAIVRPAVSDTKLTRTRIIDMRYVGQGHEIRIPLPDRALVDSDRDVLGRDFSERYRANYGLVIGDMPVEIVTWSVTVSGGDKEDRVPEDRELGTLSAQAVALREVFDGHAGEVLDAALFQRGELAAGVEIDGPAIIAEDQTSTVVTACFRARVDSTGNLWLERKL